MPSPSVWGTVFHDSMMFVALSYPENPSSEYRKETETFFRMWIDRLPCYTCRIHARAYVSDHPPRLKSSSDFVDYVVHFHNDINARSGKKHDWTREEALSAFYRRFYSNLAQLPQAEWKRREDHRLMKEVAAGKVCVCKLQETSATSPSEIQQQPSATESSFGPVRPLVIQRGFVPETNEDFAWVILLFFVLIALVVIGILATKLQKRRT